MTKKLRDLPTHYFGFYFITCYLERIFLSQFECSDVRTQQRSIAQMTKSKNWVTCPHQCITNERLFNDYMYYIKPK